MYIPASFRVDDRDVLYRFIDEYSFAALVTVSSDGLFATHLPLLIDRERGVLLGHFARANPHADTIGTAADSLAIFSGPHAYISPSWYATAPAVPTWNYAVVHVSGSLEPLSESRTRDLIDRTVDKYESALPQPWPNDLPEDFRAKLLTAIVAFELPIRRIEGKFKLGQNRSEADQAAMLDHLKTAGADGRSPYGSDSHRLAEFIARFRDRDEDEHE